MLGVQLEASEAEIEGALEGLPIAPEQLEMAEEQYAVRPRLIPSSSLHFWLRCYSVLLLTATLSILSTLSTL